MLIAVRRYRMTFCLTATLSDMSVCRTSHRTPFLVNVYFVPYKCRVPRHLSAVNCLLTLPVSSCRFRGGSRFTWFRSFGPRSSSDLPSGQQCFHALHFQGRAVPSALFGYVGASVHCNSRRHSTAVLPLQSIPVLAFQLRSSIPARAFQIAYFVATLQVASMLPLHAFSIPFRSIPFHCGRPRFRLLISLEHSVPSLLRFRPIQ